GVVSRHLVDVVGVDGVVIGITRAGDVRPAVAHRIWDRERAVRSPGYGKAVVHFGRDVCRRSQGVDADEVLAFSRAFGGDAKRVGRAGSQSGDKHLFVSAIAEGHT